MDEHLARHEFDFLQQVYEQVCEDHGVEATAAEIEATRKRVSATRDYAGVVATRRVQWHSRIDRRSTTKRHTKRQ